MKSKILILVGLAFMSSGFSQKTNPENMVKCEGGTYEKIIDNKKASITVAPFWISNEITNKEFRAFYLYAKQHLSDTVFWVDLVAGSQKAKKPAFVNSAKYADIIADLIDTTIWNSEPQATKYSDYFSNPKYDNYPVVGVSYAGARFYCMWKTQQAHKANLDKGLPLAHDYRIPLETEWEYAAQKLLEHVLDNRNVLKPTANTGFSNIADNVSEWTSSKDEETNKYQVVRGGSWRSNMNINERQLVNPKEYRVSIGFRIVQSAIN